MAVRKRHQLIIPTIIILQLAGCSSLSSTPDQSIVSRFAMIDSLMITADSEPLEITDATTIQQLKHLYEQAKWEPFIDTMAGDVIAIKCMQNGEESFRLLFGAGWLIEWKHGTGGIRKSVLSKESCDWLYQVTGQDH